MCSGMVVEAGAATFSDTAVTAETGEFSDDLSDGTDEAGEADGADDTVVAPDPMEDGSGDITAAPDGTDTPEGDVTIDGAEDSDIDGDLSGGTGDDTAGTQDGSTPDSAIVTDPADDGTGEETETGAEAGTDADTEADTAGDPFSDGADMSGEADIQTADVQEDVQESAPEKVNVESENRLLYTRWEYVADKDKWKLQKYQEPVAEPTQTPVPETTPEAAEQTSAAVDMETDAAAEPDVTGDTTAVQDENVDEAFTMDPAQEAEGTAGDAAADTNTPDVQAPETTPEAEQTPAAAEVQAAAPMTAQVQEPEYYTAKDGLVKVTIVDENGRELVKDATYAFDKDGYLLTGKTAVNGTGYYFLEEDKAKVTETEIPAAVATVAMAASTAFRSRAAAPSVPSMTPFNSTMGRMQVNTAWEWTGKNFRRFGSTGAEEKPNGAFGYQGQYYYVTNGVPYVGEKNLNYNGRTGLYIFEKSSGIPGRMVRNRWVSRKTKSGTQWRYFQGDGRYKSQKTGIYKIDGKSYYLLNSSGYTIRNKMTKIGKYYYLGDKNGKMYYNKLVKYGKYRYYFTGGGKRATWRKRWMRCPGAGNKYYYFGSTRGRVQEKKGYQKVTVKGKYVGWFRFSGNGNHYTNRMVGGRYYLPDGRMASGFRKVGSKYYFFERSSTKKYRGKMYKKTWVKYKNKYYYARPNGSLIENGWRRIGGQYYLFKNCVVQTNKDVVRDGTYGRLDSRGRFKEAGWVVFSNSSNKVKYMNPKTGKYVKNTKMKINGLYYYFDKNGYRRTDLTSIVKGPYSIKVDRVNGVMTVYNKKGDTPVKTIRVSVGNPISLTRPGTWTLRRANRWQLLMGPSWGQYGSWVHGGIYIHSVSGGAKTSYAVPIGEYLRLGNPASHGCIRTCVADAKWIYEKCNGAKITILDTSATPKVSDEAMKGPLGRKKLTPLRGSRNFDPTDPAVR